MLAGRARRKTQAAQQPARPGRQQRETVRAFLAAARDGRFEVAARARVAGSAARGHAATVNGRPGVISWSTDGTPLSFLAFFVADGRITEITAVADPAELARMDLPAPV
ncbi:sigma-70 family RNA polymerase sigma factor family protein [Streptomyces echinatus]|uniref:hypothetical protein n=1 Tax=Streptomyces echinatus TaxID=67293 RepID=UPI003830B66F